MTSTYYSHGSRLAATVDSNGNVVSMRRPGQVITTEPRAQAQQLFTSPIARPSAMTTSSTEATVGAAAAAPPPPPTVRAEVQAARSEFDRSLARLFTLQPHQGGAPSHNSRTEYQSNYRDLALLSSPLHSTKRDLFRPKHHPDMLTHKISSINSLSNKKRSFGESKRKQRIGEIRRGGAQSEEQAAFQPPPASFMPPAMVVRAPVLNASCVPSAGSDGVGREPAADLALLRRQFDSQIARLYQVDRHAPVESEYDAAYNAHVLEAARGTWQQQQNRPAAGLSRTAVTMNQVLAHGRPENPQQVHNIHDRHIHGRDGRWRASSAETTAASILEDVVEKCVEGAANQAQETETPQTETPPPKANETQTQTQTWAMSEYDAAFGNSKERRAAAAHVSHEHHLRSLVGSGRIFNPVAGGGSDSPVAVSVSRAENATQSQTETEVAVATASTVPKTPATPPNVTTRGDDFDRHATNQGRAKEAETETETQARFKSPETIRRLLEEKRQREHATRCQQQVPHGDTRTASTEHQSSYGPLEDRPPPKSPPSNNNPTMIPGSRTCGPFTEYSAEYSGETVQQAQDARVQTHVPHMEDQQHLVAPVVPGFVTQYMRTFEPDLVHEAAVAAPRRGVSRKTMTLKPYYAVTPPVPPATATVVTDASTHRQGQESIKRQLKTMPSTTKHHLFHAEINPGYVPRTEYMASFRAKPTQRAVGGPKTVEVAVVQSKDKSELDSFGPTKAATATATAANATTTTSSKDARTEAMDKQRLHWWRREGHRTWAQLNPLTRHPRFAPFGNLARTPPTEYMAAYNDKQSPAAISGAAPTSKPVSEPSSRSVSY